MNLHERAAEAANATELQMCSASFIDKMFVLIAEMDARIRKLEADAARYRWLKINSEYSEDMTDCYTLTCYFWGSDLGDLSADIDRKILGEAARKEQTT